MAISSVTDKIDSTSGRAESWKWFCVVPLIGIGIMFLGTGGDVRASEPSPKTDSKTASSIRATAILGFEGMSSNSHGDLSVEGDALAFQPSEGPHARIPVGSIQGVFLSQEDKEVGGAPLTLGKIAAPYGGGRVIGLFAHKKYDFLTIEYLDSNGALHGAICQLNKGQGQLLGSELAARGLHVSGLKSDNANSGGLETKNAVQ